MKFLAGPELDFDILMHASSIIFVIDTPLSLGERALRLLLCSPICKKLSLLIAVGNESLHIEDMADDFLAQTGDETFFPTVSVNNFDEVSSIVLGWKRDHNAVAYLYSENTNHISEFISLISG